MKMNRAGISALTVAVVSAGTGAVVAVSMNQGGSADRPVEVVRQVANEVSASPSESAPVTTSSAPAPSATSVAPVGQASSAPAQVAQTSAPVESTPAAVETTSAPALIAPLSNDKGCAASGATNCPKAN